ncbi:MAG: V-type ATPase subunit [archaeon]|nr:V-type ATPase subunit [archaeon]
MTMIGKAFEFGYANARVKAMKQALLGEKEINAMTEANSADGVYSLLEKTQYREDLVVSALKERTIADQIEFATTKNFSRTLQKIVKIVPKKFENEIKELFEKYDVNNLKTILVSKHLGKVKEKIEPLIIDSMSISKGRMNKILDATSVKEVVNLLGGTIYGKVLQKHLKEYEKDNEISSLIFALDEYYYSKLPSIAKNPYGDERIILKMLKSQADIRNISNICRGKKDNITADKLHEMMIKSGNIRGDVLEKACSAKNVEEAAKIFEKNYSLGKAIEEYKKTGSLIPIEMELERNVAKKGLKVLRNSVLSLGTIAGFLFLKEEEVNNIRKIVRCKEFNLPQEQIKEMTVIV